MRQVQNPTRVRGGRSRERGRVGEQHSGRKAQQIGEHDGAIPTDRRSRVPLAPWASGGLSGRRGGRRAARGGGGGGVLHG